MNKLMLLVSVVCMLGTGCKKKEADNTSATPGASAAMGSGGDMGSAMSGNGAGVATGSVGSGSAGEVKPMTSEELAKRFEECWGYFNAKKFEELKTCYATDAVSEQPGMGLPETKTADAIIAFHTQNAQAFPDQKGELQLVLVNGKDLISIALLTGTSSGPMKSPMGEVPATNKKFGAFMGHIVSFDDTNDVHHEWMFLDNATMMSQLGVSKAPARPATDKGWGPRLVVVAKDDAAEKANLEAFNTWIEAFNKHDVKMADSLAEDVVWSELANPKDMTRKELISGLDMMWKAFSDLKFNVVKSWAAGDYVAAIATFDGTNDGPAPFMGIKKATSKKVSLPFLVVQKFEAGKVKTSWVFYQNMGFATQLGLMPPPPAPGAGSAADSAAGSATK